MQPPEFVSWGSDFKVGHLYMRAMSGVPRGRPRYCVDRVYSNDTCVVFMQDLSLTGRIYRYWGRQWRNKFVPWTQEYEIECRNKAQARRGRPPDPGG